MSVFTARNSQVRSSALLATLVMVLAGLAPLGLASAAEAACSPIHVRGKAVSSGGKVLKHHNIAVFLHKRDRALGGGTTSRTGAYDIKICRSAKLAGAAKRHTGRLNLDLLAHRGDEDKPWYVRIAAGRYSNPTITVPKGFVAAKVVNESVPVRPTTTRGGGTVATGVAATETTTAYPGLMFVQAVPHMAAHYSINSSSVNNFKAVIGVESGVFKAAGELAIEGSRSFESKKILTSTRKRPRRALEVQPELTISSQYTCYKTKFNPYFPHIRSNKCVTESSGEWTGDVNRKWARFRGCGSGNADASRFTNRDQEELITSEGVKYSSTVSAGALGTSMSVSAAYGQGTNIRLTFNQGGKVHRFCAGGNGAVLARSSAFYVDSIPPPPQPCQPHTPCRD